MLGEMPKSSVGEFVLPGGYIDEDGDVYYIAQLKEMTGKEEDILASRTIPFVRRLNTVLANCIVKLTNGTKEITEREKMIRAVQKMTIGDRLFLVIALRRISLGDKLSMRVVCPECKKEGQYAVNLADLPVKNMEKRDIREYDLTLPSGKKVTMRIMLGEDEEHIAKIRNENDFLSLSILARLKEIDGKSPTLASVKELSLRDRNYIREKMNEIEGGVDTDITAECMNCGASFRVDLNIGDRNFFFPSATSEF